MHSLSLSEKAHSPSSGRETEREEAQRQRETTGNENRARETGRKFPLLSEDSEPSREQTVLIVHLEEVWYQSSSKKGRTCYSHPTLWNPMDCSPPGSSVHRILQARILEWIAISFSSGSSQPRDRSLVSWIAGGFFTVFNSELGKAQVQVRSPAMLTTC